MLNEAYWMTGKINLDKVEEKFLFQGKTGKFIDLVLIPAEGKFGNEHIITQGIPMAMRKAGHQGPILGNTGIPKKKNAAGKQAALL